MQVTIDTAKSQLSKLIAAAEAGEDIVIVKGSQPAARVVAFRKSPFKLGIMGAELGDSVPDFLEAMDDESLSDWEGRR